jgi:hypothetical protein
MIPPAPGETRFAGEGTGRQFWADGVMGNIQFLVEQKLNFNGQVFKVIFPSDILSFSALTFLPIDKISAIF